MLTTNLCKSIKVSDKLVLIPARCYGARLLLFFFVKYYTHILKCGKKLKKTLKKLVIKNL